MKIVSSWRSHEMTSCGNEFCSEAGGGGGGGEGAREQR